MTNYQLLRWLVETLSCDIHHLIWLVWLSNAERVGSNISATANATDFKFCILTAMRSLILAMSECSLRGRCQGHVSNFYIVDLENFATASRRYTSDIRNTSVVGLFMKPIRQWKRLDRVMVECTCLLHIGPLQPSNFITSICSGLVVQVLSALLLGNWQDFNWHDASRGPSAIAELLVMTACHNVVLILQTQSTTVVKLSRKYAQNIHTYIFYFSKPEWNMRYVCNTVHTAETLAEIV